LKIGILSDIHVDLGKTGPQRVLEGITAAIIKNDIDTMIIAGDVANDYEITLQTLHQIENAAGVRCLFVPGNHDIWNEKHPDKTAWEIYDALKAFSGNLANGPAELVNGWVAIGDLGWYDYSFGSPQYSVEEFDRMKINNRLWQDKVKAVWQRSTLDIHRHFHSKLEKQLDACKNSNIILVTHVLPIKDFTVQPPNGMWQYLNAFLGSKQYGELALEYAVKYSISGHVHYRKQKMYENTTFICNCLNYPSQWIDNDDPVLEVARAIKTIEISDHRHSWGYEHGSWKGPQQPSADGR
jgi:putative phosphoesterase